VILWVSKKNQAKGLYSTGFFVKHDACEHSSMKIHIKLQGEVQMKGIPMSKESRTMVFVDLENCCGGSSNVVKYQKQVRSAVQHFISSSHGFVVLATGIRALQEVPDLLWEWGEARYLIGHGLDGADKQLVSALVQEPVAARSTRVVLLSGDHIFAEPIKRLTKQGIHTTVAARPGSMAHTLRDAASSYVWLPDYESNVLGMTVKESQ
jgi:hypothetical protein